MIAKVRTGQCKLVFQSGQFWARGRVVLAIACLPRLGVECVVRRSLYNRCTARHKLPNTLWNGDFESNVISSASSPPATASVRPSTLLQEKHETKSLLAARFGHGPGKRDTASRPLHGEAREQQLPDQLLRLRQLAPRSSRAFSRLQSRCGPSAIATSSPRQQRCRAAQAMNSTVAVVGGLGSGPARRDGRSRKGQTSSRPPSRSSADHGARACSRRSNHGCRTQAGHVAGRADQGKSS